MPRRRGGRDGVQETAALTVKERKTLLTGTIDAVDGNVPILAGVSHPAQPVVNDLISYSEQVGADALLAMPPWGVAPEKMAILKNFRTLASVASVPVVVYNNPSATVDMDKKTMAEVARIDGIEYVKERSRDWAKIAWLVERIQHARHADVLTTMDVLLYTLQVGGVGGIIPAPASAPCMQIYDAYQAGNLETAVRVQRSFGTFPPDEVSEGLIAACKAGAEISGFDLGDPRPPYSPVSGSGRKALAAWLVEQGVTDSNG